MSLRELLTNYIIKSMAGAVKHTISCPRDNLVYIEKSTLFVQSCHMSFAQSDTTRYNCS